MIRFPYSLVRDAMSGWHSININSVRFVLSVVCWSLLLSQTSFAQVSPSADSIDETPAKPAVGALATDASSEEAASVPAVFSRRLPQSVDELRVMQDHITQLVPRISAATVNLRIGRAQGSGVIVSPDGMVLSAAHVTGPPGIPILIVTSDGKQYQGTTLGRNTTLDESMVQIDSNRTDWPYCNISKEKLKRGDWCLAMGHPGGFQRDRGLVLRLGRVIDHNEWLIQTDCELMGGDSGGPLFSMAGEVIGINTRIGENTDYNFHVPSSAFNRDWDRLVASEDFKSHSGAYLGVAGIPAESGDGLLIQTVEPGAPADREGIVPGDIILNFEDQPVKSLEQLIELVGNEFPGQSVHLLLLHDGEKEIRSVRLGMKRD